ncbi:MAG TPA: class I SAM-dependent methyltransferase [Desulfurivibrionaceae bacterium]|nr:class I SAM-dependent methyltransferase [Desulfurivibrionaceae bacterium]
MATVILKKGRDKSVRHRHPWIFSGAIDRVEGDPASGATVAVQAADGTPLGWGAWSPESQITVRLWSTDPKAMIDADFFRARLTQALASRPPLAGSDNALRLVNGEPDGLPGLIVDRYADFLVAQIFSAGAEHWKNTIADLLLELTGCTGIYERSEAEVRDKEGLPRCCGRLAGAEPPPLIEISEGGFRYQVDIRQGHKTGFYLDQRDNRARVARYCQEAAVLNCFAYSGGFSVAALGNGARLVENIDTSAAALALARQNIALNGFAEERTRSTEGDVFRVLRRYVEEGKRFDVVILDPPKFIESRRHLERASRGYKDINLLAFKLLTPGGILATFSCSGLMDRELFERTVAYAALDAGREARVLEWLDQAADHPAALHFPEGKYLKGLICRVW